MNLLETDAHTYRLWIFVIALILIGALTIYIFARVSKKEKLKVSQLKAAYEAALKSGNKQLALEKGRQYYKALRGTGRLTIYDEQAISNDISAM